MSPALAQGRAVDTRRAESRGLCEGLCFISMQFFILHPNRWLNGYKVLVFPPLLPSNLSKVMFQGDVLGLFSGSVCSGHTMKCP